MKKACFSLIIFTSLCCYAQQTKLYPVLKTVGKNHMIDYQITAWEYTFNDRIYDFQIDTTRNLFYIELRNVKTNGKYYEKKGKALLINSESNDVIYERKINFKKERLYKMEDYLISTREGKTEIINIKKLDKPALSVKNSIFLVDFTRDIGLGYKGLGFWGGMNYGFDNSVKYSKTIEGIDLKNGNILWQRDFVPENTFHDLWPVSDSVYLIIALGLHTVNTQTGEGWDYSCVTYDNNFKRTANYIMGIKGVQSNLLVDSLHYFFAGKDKLSCLTKEGTVIWSAILPLNKTSKSNIFVKNEILYMINYGFIDISSSTKYPYGKPYITAFDVQTGMKIYHTDIVTEKEMPIMSFDIVKDTCYLLFKDRIEKYNLSNGTVLFTKIFDLDKVNYFEGFVGGRVFVQTDSIYQTLTQIDTTKHYIINSSSDILTLDKDFNEVARKKREDLYLDFARVNGFHFLRKKDETIIINNEKKKVAEINASPRAWLKGNVLYDKKDYSFLVIKLGHIVGNDSNSFDLDSDFRFNLE